MKNLKLIIFDLDGTLYSFDKGKSNGFTSSQFYSDIRKNAFAFFSRKLSLTLEEAEKEFNQIKQKYNGEISLGVEKEYGITRYEYFDSVWNLKPEDYIEKNPNLKRLFSRLNAQVAVLTAAPRVWATVALNYLELNPYVGNSLFTGEPSIRKPNSEAFQQVLDYFNVKPEEALSIGDQEQTDIIPAKMLGMKTIIVGSESKYTDYSIKRLDDLLEIMEPIQNGKNNN
jgi:putative hydrolase of the HAD superfamily